MSSQYCQIVPLRYTCRSLEFYKKVCGFKVEVRINGGYRLRMFSGGHTFEVFPTKPNENPGPSHIAIIIDDLDATVKELREKGYQVSDHVRKIG